MRSYPRWAWISAAIVMAAAVAGVAFAALDGGDGGRDESEVAASGSSSPTSEPPATPCSAGCASSGIEGRVVQSPTCPVETDPPKPECAPRPYQATIVVWNADHSAQVVTFTTDENGQFRVPLAPGEYEIDPQGEGRYPMPPPPFVVTVPPDQFVRLEIDYDTGIR